MFFILSNNKIISYDINSPDSSQEGLLTELYNALHSINTSRTSTNNEINNGKQNNGKQCYDSQGVCDLIKPRIQIDGKLLEDGWYEKLKSEPESRSFNRPIPVDWYYPIKGGFVIEVIEAVIGIFRFVLYIPKAFIWIGRMVVWCIKTFIYLFVIVSQVINQDGILGLVRFIAMEVLLTPFMLLGELLKRGINSLGQQTVGAVIIGADNVVDDNLDPQNNDGGDDLPSDNCLMGDRKCFKTEDGSVPITVIMATVLFPPAGVFMEYGLHGWLQILLCFLLTLAFYFPGLIYGLVLLYC